MATTVTDKYGTRTYSGGKQTSGSSIPGSSYSNTSSSSKKSSGSSGGSSGGGYAYTDKYGITHVVKSYDTAKKYASGDIYNYSGSYDRGYARNEDGGRIALDLPGATGFTNARQGYDTNITPTGAIGGIATAPLTPSLPTFTLGTSTTTPSGASYFGMSPEQYAAEIRRKESLGLTLSNPQAAAAFKAANPGLFGATSAMPSLVPETPSYADLPIPRAMEYPEFKPEPYRYTGPEIRIADEQYSIPTLAAQGQWYDQQRDAYNAQLGQYSEEQRVLENYLAQQRQEQQRQQELELTRAELQRELEEQKRAEALQRWQILGVADQTVAEVLGVPVGTPTDDAAYRQSSLSLRGTSSGGGSPGGSSGGSSGGTSASASVPNGGLKPTTAVTQAKPALTALKQRGYGKQSALEYMRQYILPNISQADQVAYNKAIADLEKYLETLFPSGTGELLLTPTLTSPGES